MSATLDPDLFMKYFEKKLNDGTVIRPGHVECNFSLFETKEYYLNDIKGCETVIAK